MIQFNTKIERRYKNLFLVRNKKKFVYQELIDTELPVWGDNYLTTIYCLSNLIRLLYQQANKVQDNMFHLINATFNPKCQRNEQSNIPKFKTQLKILFLKAEKWESL